MPTLLRWRDGAAVVVADPFLILDDDAPVPAGDVIVSMIRFQIDGEKLLGEGRRVGVRVGAGEAVEALAYYLPRISVVALEFPKFRDGRAYSAARVLRERLAYGGEVRAVGDVRLDQAKFMVRCGFDAFEPADGASPDAWTLAAFRFRHVYQRAADGRAPGFAGRGGA